MSPRLAQVVKLTVAFRKIMQIFIFSRTVKLPGNFRICLWNRQQVYVLQKQGRVFPVLVLLEKKPLFISVMTKKRIRKLSLRLKRQEKTAISGIMTI